MNLLLTNYIHILRFNIAIVSELRKAKMFNTWIKNTELIEH